MVKNAFQKLFVILILAKNNVKQVDQMDHVYGKINVDVKHVVILLITHFALKLIIASQMAENAYKYLLVQVMKLR
jgi:hypothetical protein